MKKLLLFLPALFYLASCSNEVEVTAPWQEIPVVYGILSPQDTAHYIRIEKAFVDPEKSALQIAQIVDSLYYPENAISVFLEKKGSSTRLPLHRVDGALEGYPRTEGIFAGEPNWLYKLSGGLSLEAGQTYRLVIERKDGKPNITAETTLPKDFLIRKPDISDQVPKVSFEGSKISTFTWDTDENGVFFNLYLVVRINERNLNGTLAGTQTLVWEMGKNIERDDIPGSSTYRGSYTVAGTSFYNFLAKNLQRPAPNRYREFSFCDLILEGGGKEIKEYLETANANSNITGAETFPNYTNISEGFGIFTAKNVTVGQNIRMDTKTVDSMRVNSIVDTLGFSY